MNYIEGDTKSTALSKSVSGPSNLTSRIVKMIPDPTNILMNPATFPIILISILLIYLGGGGDMFIKNPALIASALGGLFLIFIIIKLTKKPSWQQI
jgi:hypothetical protein